MTAVGADDAALRALREASAEWSSEYDRLTREQPEERKTRAAYRLASVLAGQRADALAVVPQPVTQPEGWLPCCGASGGDHFTHCSSTTPSQPAHGVVLTEAERERVEEIRLRWSGPPDLQCDVDYLLDLADRLAAQPAHGDREALADWLGALPEARNVFDITDEATTVLTMPVEDLADALIAAGFVPAHGDNEAALRAAIDDAHEQQRQTVALGRDEETMTLFQHWSATAGWLASRIRAIRRGDEPDWPDAMNTAALSASAEPEGAS